MEKPEVSYEQARFDRRKYYSDKELEEIKNNWVSYIDSKYTIGYSEETTCVKSQNGAYRYFGINKAFAHMYGAKPENILKCKVTIIEDHVSIKEKYQSKDYNANCIDYFGWVYYTNNDDKEHGIVLIQPNIKVYCVQFAGSAEYEVSQGMGKIVRLKVELI